MAVLLEATAPFQRLVLQAEYLMPNRLLSMLLEERQNLEAVNSRELMASLQQYGKNTVGQRQVFKDYLLSSEVFYIDTELQ